MNIFQGALLNALMATAYIVAVVSITFGLEDSMGPQKKFIGPVLFLLLFVISAAVMGMTVFGRSVLWYLEGKKIEAVKLTILTVLFLITIAGAIMILIISGLV